MNQTNPMRWDDIPEHEIQAGIDALRAQQEICSTLSNIFVNKMGVARQITLALNPETRNREIHFMVDKNSSIPKELIADEIQGIPVRLIMVD